MSAGKKEPFVKKELIVLLVAALAALAVIAAAFYFLGIQLFQATQDEENQGATASINYDPGSALGSKIAESTSNPMSNIPLNPFSD